MIFCAEIIFCLYFTHKMQISQFSRPCSHYDIMVTSYINDAKQKAINACLDYCSIALRYASTRPRSTHMSDMKDVFVISKPIYLITFVLFCFVLFCFVFFCFVLFFVFCFVFCFVVVVFCY